MIEQLDDRLAIWGPPGAGMNFVAGLLSKHEIMLEANNEFFFVQRGQREINCGHLEQEYFKLTRKNLSDITPSEYRRLVAEYKTVHPRTKHLVITTTGWTTYIKGLVVAKRRANQDNYEPGKLHPLIARNPEIMRRGTVLNDGWDSWKYREDPENRTHQHYIFASKQPDQEIVQTVNYGELIVNPDVNTWQQLAQRWSSRLSITEILSRVALYHTKNVELLNSTFPHLKSDLQSFLSENS